MDHSIYIIAALLQTRHISALNYISPGIPGGAAAVVYREPFLNIARSGERFIASKLNGLPVIMEVFNLFLIFSKLKNGVCFCAMKYEQRT
jgi:hypothetical protein